MKQHGFKKLLFALFLVWTSLCIITPAALALDETALSGIPGAEQWQPYLEQSPVSISDFADAPLDALKKLFHGSMAAALQETLRGSTDALLFLLLAALLSFLTSETTNGELLDLIAVGAVFSSGASSSRLRNSSVHRWESGAAFCWGFSRSMPES